MMKGGVCMLGGYREVGVGQGWGGMKRVKYEEMGHLLVFDSNCDMSKNNFYVFKFEHINIWVLVINNNYII